MTYRVQSARGYEGTSPHEASADKAAHEISTRQRGLVQVTGPDGKVIARHSQGQRIIRKVAGFGPAAEPQYVAVPFEPRPRTRVGFGLAS